MTNAEYIKSKMSDVDLAWMLEMPVINSPLFIDQIRDAFSNWAHSVSGNHGNMAKGNHGKTVIKEDPSIWAFEKWGMPDGTWLRKRKDKKCSVAGVAVKAVRSCGMGRTR